MRVEDFAEDVRKQTSLFPTVHYGEQHKRELLINNLTKYAREIALEAFDGEAGTMDAKQVWRMTSKLYKKDSYLEGNRAISLLCLETSVASRDHPEETKPFTAVRFCSESEALKSILNPIQSLRDFEQVQVKNGITKETHLPFGPVIHLKPYPVRKSRIGDKAYIISR